MFVNYEDLVSISYGEGKNKIRITENTENRGHDNFVAPPPGPISRWRFWHFVVLLQFLTTHIPTPSKTR
jgi:hypothetical protein